MKIEQGPPNTDTTTKTITPSLSVDLEKYVTMLGELDIPTPEKYRVLESLEIILLSFIDLGFGVNFVSQSCGQASETQAEPLSTDSADMLHSLQSIITDEHAAQDADAEGSAL